MGCALDKYSKIIIINTCSYAYYHHIMEKLHMYIISTTSA